MKQISPWRNFNFDNPKLYNDNISIIKKIENDLYDRGYLKRMVLYFDTTVEEGLGKNELQRLIQIATRFGATITKDVNEVVNGRVTHIVAYDPEEHDTKEVIDEEERREKNNEEMDKSFLKTLAVVEVPVDAVGEEEEDDTSTSANASPDSKKNGEEQQQQPSSTSKPSPNPPPASGTKQKGRPCGQCEACSREDCGECRQCKDKKKFGGPNKLRQRCCMRLCHNSIVNDGGGGDASSTTNSTNNASATTTTPRQQQQPPPPLKKMALVHWWYFPSSYDEWMPAEEVSTIIEVDGHPGIPGGPAVVGCKFIRDVEKFNEWGVESDYAVME